jgi:cobalt-zinc-cadmium efflux system protein
VDGVAGIHDLHVWTLTSGIVMLTAHATLERSIDAQRALRGMGEVVRERFGIRHCTIQPEVGAAFPGEPPP